MHPNFGPKLILSYATKASDLPLTRGPSDLSGIVPVASPGVGTSNHRTSLKSRPGGYTDPSEETSTLRPHEPNMDDQAKPVSRHWRRMLRFSVRRLIVLVVLVGSGLGLWIHAARVQRDAVVAITKARGSARYNIWFGRDGNLSSRESWAPARLKNWLGVDYFDTVTAVYLTPDVIHRSPFYVGPLDSRDFNPILAHVARLDQLEWLDLSVTSVTDADLVHLRRLRRLKRLELRATSIADHGLGNLSVLTGLDTLNLRGTKITDAGPSSLDAMIGLKSLSLDRTRITDAGLTRLKNKTRLTFLSLSETQLTDAGLSHLEGLIGLESLILKSNDVTDAGLARLQKLRKLKNLDVSNTKIVDAGFAHLKRLAALYVLDVASTGVTDLGLAELEGLGQLGYLVASNCKITDAGLMHLKRLPKLSFLNVSGTRVTDTGVKELQQALPSLKIIR